MNTLNTCTYNHKYKVNTETPPDNFHINDAPNEGDAQKIFFSKLVGGNADFEGTIQYIKIYDSYKSSGDVTTLYNNYIGTGNICFLGNTKVKTDSGYIRFDKLTKKHSLLNNNIKKIVTVINSDDTMIFIKKKHWAKEFLIKIHILVEIMVFISIIH